MQEFIKLAAQFGSPSSFKECRQGRRSIAYTHQQWENKARPACFIPFFFALSLPHGLIYNRDLVHENETFLRYKNPLSISHTPCNVFWIFTRQSSVPREFLYAGVTKTCNYVRPIGSTQENKDPLQQKQSWCNGRLKARDIDEPESRVHVRAFDHIGAHLRPLIHMLLVFPFLYLLAFSVVRPSLIPNRTIFPSPTMIRALLFYRENRPFPPLYLHRCVVKLSWETRTQQSTPQCHYSSFTLTQFASMCVCECVGGRTLTEKFLRSPRTHCAVQRETWIHGGINISG